MSEVIATGVPRRPINYQRNFALLLTGFLVSNLGTGIFNFAVSLYVLGLTGSAQAFSTVLMFGIIPRIFVNVFAATLVDKYDRKTIVVLFDFLSGLTVLGFMFFLGNKAHIIQILVCCNMLLGAIMAMYNLGVAASLPNLVRPNEVVRINGAMQSIGATLAIIGPIIGAVAYKAVGIEMIFLLNGISFILAAGAECFLQFYKHEEPVEEGKTYWQNLAEGFNYIRGERVLRFLLIFAVFIQTIYVPLTMVVVPYIMYNVIKVSGIQLAVIQGSWACGMVLGGLFVGLNRNALRNYLGKFFILLETQSVLIILWFFPALPYFQHVSKWFITIPFSLILIVTGMLNVIQNAPIIGYFQVVIPDQIRARVTGITNTALTISAPIGLAIFGFVLARVNWVFVPVVSGILMLLYCAYSSTNRTFRVFIRGVREGQPAPAAGVAPDQVEPAGDN